MPARRATTRRTRAPARASTRARTRRAPARAAARARAAPASVDVPKTQSSASSNGYMPGFGSTMGSAVGGFFGGPAGGAVGSKLGGWLGKITGLGSYKVNRNTILMPDPPTVSNTTSGIRIKHREYIQDVQSSILFNNQFILPIQPGLAESFPWLSGIASNFTQYKIHGLIYEYITTSGSAIASTNNSLGEVMMATNYNSGDSTFSNKQQMLNEEFSSSGVPSANLIHPIECASAQTTVERLYTRVTTAVPSGQDIRLYDLGLFQLAVQGQQVGTGQGGSTSVTLGELYCSYDIEFFKPQLDEFEGITNIGTHLRATVGVTASVPLGTAQIVKFDSIGVTVNGATGTTITFPAGYIGNYVMNCQWIGSEQRALSCPRP